MLGLGSSLVTSPAPQRTLVDKTYTFTSSSDVSDWSIGDSARVDSLAYQSSTLIGGVSYSNLMKVTLVGNASAGNGYISLSNALTEVSDGSLLKIEVDYAIGKFNDVSLRIASLSLGGTSVTVDGSDQSANTFRQVAPGSTAAMGSSNNDLQVYIPADTGISSGDIIYIQRIRVYEP